MSRLVVVGAALCAAMCSLAACDKPTSGSHPTPSSSSPTLASLDAGALLQYASGQLTDAAIFHVKGSAVDGGSTVAFDLIETTTTSAGSIDENSTKFSIISVGGTIYMKAPDSFLESQLGASDPQVLAKLSGKWLKQATNAETFGPFANKAATVTQIVVPALDVVKKGIQRTGTKTVDGVECIELTSGDGTTVVDIDAVAGRVVAVRGGDATSGAEFHFGEYGTAVAPSEPSADQVFDVDAGH